MAKIAVVDDAPANRDLLVTILGAMGHETVEAGNGLEALDLVRRERPALIICDVLMPTMDGYEFVRQLRTDTRLAAVPVIFYTAYYQEQEARRLAKACGVSDVLTKPAEVEQIMRLVDQVLARTASHRPVVVEPPAEFDREHLRLVTDKLSQKVVEVQAVNQRLSALVDLNVELASQRDASRLLARVCERARVLLGAAYASLVVKNPGGHAVGHVHHSGIEPAVEERLGPGRIDSGVLASVASGRLTLRLGPSRIERDRLGLPEGYPPVSCVAAAPIASLTEAYGWICLTNKEGAQEFSEDDERLLRILGAQAGRIFENGSLYDRIERHAADLEREAAERERARRHLSALYETARLLADAQTFDEVSAELLDALCRRLGFAAATLWGVDDKAHVLRCLHMRCEPVEACAELVARSRQLTLAHGEGLPGRAWASGRIGWVPEIMNDQDFSRRREAALVGLRCGAAVPVSVRGRVVGVVDFLSTTAGDAEPGMLDTLAAAGDQIGQFFERNEQRQRILRLNRVYAVLSGINSAIVRLRERAALFREACRISVELGRFGIAWVGETDPATGLVRPVAQAGTAVDAGAIEPGRDEADPGAALAREAVERAKPVFVNELTGRPEPGCALAVELGYRSLIALPLVLDGTGIGAITLYSREPDVFAGEELDLLVELAGDISFALEYLDKQDRLVYLANYDPLTALPNRSLWLARLGAALEAVRQNRGRAGVVVCEIDRFRNVNDAFGRAAGDSLLREAAERLRQTWPNPTSLARVAPDQFAAIVTDFRDATDIAHLLEESVIPALDRPYEAAGKEFRIALSFGIAICPDDGNDAESVTRSAEAALGRSKQSGRRYLFFRPEMAARIAETLTLETKLRRAWEHSEFELYYQPKVSDSPRQVTGLEALIRWNDPDAGVVMPERFVPILEETGMIHQVGAWAIRQAVDDVRRWAAEGIAAPRIAVNVSALQLQQKDFVDEVRRTVRAYDGVPVVVDLEVTETMIMTDVEQAIVRLGVIRDMGLDIHIDDFGTGYSSLGYLARLPVSALKIDRSFIDTLTTRRESMTIVSTIISLAHAMGMKVVAEGVESDEQAKFLRQLKCDELQGYLISHPLRRNEMGEFLRNAASKTIH